MMQRLNLTEFPLDSLALIEASAGTGKTYALANLYLRYLLERRLTVEQILVVTFTEAATQELKDRIRSRIHELRRIFEGEPTKDPVLQHLYAQSAVPEQDQLLLRVAERQIDQAQIHTIHGFCQQVIKGHALDANLPLKQTLLEGQTQIRKQVLEDFWRRHVTTLNETAIHYVVQNWPDPQSLLGSMQLLLNRTPEALLPTPTESGLTDWLVAFQKYQSWLTELQNKTLALLPEVEKLLTERPLKRNKDKLKWLAQMRVWAESGADFQASPATGGESVFTRFTQSRVREETPNNKPVPEHAYFVFLEAHLQVPVPDLNALFLAQSYPLVSAMIDEAKAGQNGFSFDDLIKRVSHALKVTGATLSASIAEAYEVALIDEFQDTDPEQYFIFNTLFGTESVKARPRLVLIGDPKQAIYGFRGGDLQTYLLAKRRISAHPQGCVFTMDTNWRSAPAMVDAVNAVFGMTRNAFMAEDIPFQPVQAARKSVAALPSHALFISQLVLQEKASKAELEAQLAGHCVRQIVGLIEQSGQLTLEDERSLQHSDIAVLVRSAREGELMKQMLAQAGLIATLDSQSSVYHTIEARALYFLLAAVADPRDEQALRRCLAEPFFGLDDHSILAFNEQASVFSQYLQHFEYLHQRWQKAGVLSMIREALNVLGVFDYWHQQSVAGAEAQTMSVQSAARLWERALTNWNQLAEILQHQSRIQKGHFALLRWYQDTLAAALSESGTRNDEHKLRLESDAQLIRIVTIHKSKGLEYPFVFIPFLFSGMAAKQAWFYNAQGQLTLDLSAADASLVAAEKERLGEDIRLLYVALTRAKYQCYLGTTAYKGGSGSLGFADTAFAYLLFEGTRPDNPNAEQISSQLSILQSRFPAGIHIEQVCADDTLPVPEMADATVGSSESATGMPVLRARELTRAIVDDWRVQSFTGLMHEHQQLARSLQPASAFFAKNDAKAVYLNANKLSIFQFPKGSQAGTFLHTLFEHLDFQTGELHRNLRDSYPDLQSYIESKLKLARLVDEGLLKSWADYLCQWVRKVLQLPLHEGICLAGLSNDQYFSEMAFYFSVKQLGSQRFNRLLQGSLKTSEELLFASFEGHLKGAIDLVFEAGGRFYILDYKSNYLGDSPTDYAPDKLHEAMQDHRYDVQYLIYSLALHRFLKQRLTTAYDYTRDFGGVIYLFLRGLNLDSQAEQTRTGTPEQRLADAENSRTGIYFTRPPLELITALDEEIGY